SLFPGEDTEVLIERTCHVVHFAGQAKSTGPKALPLYEDETLSVIVNGTGPDPCSSPSPAITRLLVDLRTFLTGVIISPAASIRYVELVAQIVQRSTHAFVTRASAPMDSDSVTPLAARRA